jgi:hemerythrin-like domain-containing protein
MDVQRRRLLHALGTGALVSAVAAPQAGEAEVTPGEDLMQEHGVLERLLLIYAEVARRIRSGEEVDVDAATSAARIVRRFVENYHERNEETFVFPELLRRGKLVKLVELLQLQHARGRMLTQDILRLSEGGKASVPLLSALGLFERMYRPHAAREDTVVFPAFRGLLGREAYQDLGGRMELQERRVLGEDGFLNTVNEVAKIEAALRIEDLAQFTPS